MGEGKWESGNSKKKTKEYETWKKMLQRCYDEKYQARQPTYKGIIVDSRWHNFQVFCEDIQKLQGYEDWKNNKGLELDKDVLCEKLNISQKIYSKDTCMFITKKDNNSNENKKISLTGLKYIAHRISDGYEEEFINQIEFSKKWSLTEQCVNYCIKGKSKKHKGWTFKIKEQIIN